MSSGLLSLESALLLSLRVGLLSSLAICVPAVAMGWLLARKSFPGKGLLDLLVHAPLVLPPVLTGYALLLILGRRSWLGSWLESWFGLRLSFEFAGAVIAAALMSFPLLVRSVRLAVEWVDPRLETAALLLGSSPFRVFFRVTLPLALPGLISGWVLAFVRAIGEFGATISFAGNVEGVTRTLPSAIYTALQMPGGESEAAWLAACSLTLALGPLALGEWLAKRLRQRWGLK